MYLLQIPDKLIREMKVIASLTEQSLQDILQLALELGISELKRRVTLKGFGQDKIDEYIDEYIKANWNEKKDREIAKGLGGVVAPISVRTRRLKLGLKRPKEGRPIRQKGRKRLSKDEVDKYIKANWNGKTDNEIAKGLGGVVAPISVRTRRLKLGLKRPRKGRPIGQKWRRWTEKEILFLQRNWRKMYDQVIADKLNVTRESVQFQRAKLGLLKRKKRG